MIRWESLNALESLSLLRMPLLTEAILQAIGTFMILACVRARSVDTAADSDALHPCSQVAYLMRNLLLRSRIANTLLIQVIIHMVNTVRAVSVVRLMGRICMVCNIGAIGHRGDRHFAPHRIIFGVYWHTLCSTCEDFVPVHIRWNVVIGPDLMRRQVGEIMIPRSGTLVDM